MSGIGFFELVLLFMIGLVVLGPKRLPKVANQLGAWVGQARRMARVMKRQLEEELDLKEDINSLRTLRDDLKKDLAVDPGKPYIPRDDDNFSAAHGQPSGPKPDETPKAVSATAAGGEAKGVKNDGESPDKETPA